MKEKIIEQLTALSTAAFGLVAALAWNGAIQELFKQVFGAAAGLAAMFGYAILVTIIAIFVTYFISKAGDHAKERLAARDLAKQQKQQKRK
jgi:hypothetical protein